MLKSNLKNKNNFKVFVADDGALILSKKINAKFDENEFGLDCKGYVYIFDADCFVTLDTDITHYYDCLGEL